MQLIKKFEVLYDRYARDYTIEIEKITKDFQRIKFKFDTGASNTTITVNSLFTNSLVSAKVILYFKKCRDEKKYLFNDFRSASGDYMSGVLCSIDNFTFTGFSPFKFYFYLIFSTAYQKALLGVDFIECCDFNCKPRENIEIENFHDSMYSAMFGITAKTHAIDVNDLITMAQDVVLPENFSKFRTKDGYVDLQRFINSIDLNSSQLKCYNDSNSSAKDSFAFI